MDGHRFSLPVRRFGYGASIVLAVIGLWVASNILDWGWLPWLTTDFDQVLPWVIASFAASIVVNAFFLADDRKRLRRVGDLLTTSVSLIATIQMLTVFPFDFDAYAFNWDLLVRALLGLAVFGMAVGLIASVITLVRDAARLPAHH